MRPRLSMECSLSVVNLCPGKREIEGRTSIHCSLRPNPASMPVDDALYSGQPYPGAFEFFRPVQALKHAKKLIDVLHLESRAVVPHEHLDLIVLDGRRADL